MQNRVKVEGWVGKTWYMNFMEDGETGGWASFIALVRRLDPTFVIDDSELCTDLWMETVEGDGESEGAKLPNGLVFFFVGDCIGIGRKIDMPLEEPGDLQEETDVHFISADLC